VACKRRFRSFAIIFRYFSLFITYAIIYVHMIIVACRCLPSASLTSLFSNISLMRLPSLLITPPYFHVDILRLLFIIVIYVITIMRYFDSANEAQDERVCSRHDAAMPPYVY